MFGMGWSEKWVVYGWHAAYANMGMRVFALALCRLLSNVQRHSELAEGICVCLAVLALGSCHRVNFKGRLNSRKNTWVIQPAEMQSVLCI